MNKYYIAESGDAGGMKVDSDESMLWIEDHERENKSEFVCYVPVQLGLFNLFRPMFRRIVTGQEDANQATEDTLP